MNARPEKDVSIAVVGGSESPSVCQNNVSIGMTVPKDIEYLHLVHSVTIGSLDVLGY